MGQTDDGRTDGHQTDTQTLPHTMQAVSVALLLSVLLLLLAAAASRDVVDDVRDDCDEGAVCVLFQRRS